MIDCKIENIFNIILLSKMVKSSVYHMIFVVLSVICSVLIQNENLP